MDDTVKPLKLNTFANVDLFKFEIKFVKDGDYIYLELIMRKRCNMNLKNNLQKFRTFSVSNYSDIAKLDLKLSKRKGLPISFTLYDIGRYEGIWNDLYHKNSPKEPKDDSRGIEERDIFTMCVLYAQLYNKAKEEGHNWNQSKYLNQIKKNLNTLKINNNVKSDKLKYLSNKSMGGGKQYVNLQTGGKRLVRYGKRGGRYYMKGGKKHYIK